MQAAPFGRALLIVLPPGHAAPAAGMMAPRARGLGCCYVVRTEQLKNASASLTAAGAIQQAAVGHIIKNDRQSYYYCSIHIQLLTI